MTIVGIDHVQLAMPAGREDDARWFYADILEIPEKPKPAELAKRGGVWFENDAVKVHLGVEADFRPGRKAHPALRVHGLGVLVARLGTTSMTSSDLEVMLRNRPFQRATTLPRFAGLVFAADR